MSDQEAYEILGLTPQSTEEEVQKRYRDLMKVHHPDIGGDPKIASKINNARDVLLKLKSFKPKQDYSFLIKNINRLSEFGAFIAYLTYTLEGDINESLAEFILEYFDNDYRKLEYYKKNISNCHQLIKPFIGKLPKYISLGVKNKLVESSNVVYAFEALNVYIKDLHKDFKNFKNELKKGNSKTEHLALVRKDLKNLKFAFEMLHF